MKYFYIFLLVVLGSTQLFSQYSLRSVEMRFLRFSVATGSHTDEVKIQDGYEILSGDSVSADFYPVGLFANVGTRALPSIKVMYHIVNEETRDVIYSNTVLVEPSAWKNFTSIEFTDSSGVPLGVKPDSISAGAFFKVRFPKIFIREQNSLAAGLYVAKAFVVPEFADGTPFTDVLVSDDSIHTFVYLTKRVVPSDFTGVLGGHSIVSRKHIVMRSDGIVVPSPLRFISKGADVISGDSACYNVGHWYPSVQTQKPNSRSISHPVIRMNRKGFKGEEPVGVGGDTLTSHPIDVRGLKNVLLVIEVQRAGIIPKHRRWADSVLYGPEHRVTNGVDSANALRNSDDLIVEFATPTSSFEKANTTEWNIHPRKGGLSTITDNPALTLFGGGGKRLGVRDYDEKTSEVGAEEVKTREQGLKVRYNDSGKDENFVRYAIMVPDTLLHYPNNGSASFRFRLRVAAKNDGNTVETPRDDDDNFYIRTISLIGDGSSKENTDVSVVGHTFGIERYRMVSLSSANQTPISCIVSNNTLNDVQSFNVTMVVFPFGMSPDSVWSPLSRAYRRAFTLPFMPGGSNFTVPFPNINMRLYASMLREQTFVTETYVVFPGGDLIAENDTLHSNTLVKYGNCNAYDTDDSIGVNDVPAYTGVVGSGIGFDAPSELKVENVLQTQDTLYGYQALWGSAITDTTMLVEFSLQEYPSGKTIPGSQLICKRGFDDVTNSVKFDQYTTYLFKKPLILAPRQFYVVVRQLGTTPFGLGANAQRTAVVSTAVGTKVEDNKQISAVHGFTRIDRLTGVLVGSYPVYADSIAPFIPSAGAIRYPHFSDAYGTTHGYKTYLNATWIPAIRPYFVDRRFVTPKNFPRSITVGSRIVRCGSFRISASDTTILSFVLEQSSKNVTMKLDTIGTTVTATFVLVDISKVGDVQLEIRGENTQSVRVTQLILPVLKTPTISLLGGTLNIFDQLPKGTKYQWFLNDTAIVGATFTWYTPVKNGRYYLQVSDTVGCVAVSNLITVQRTSIEETQEPLEVVLRPNPANDNVQLTLYSQSKEGVKVTVLDALGTVVCEFDRPSSVEFLSDHVLNTSYLASGMYTLKVIRGATALAVPLCVIH